MLKLAKYFSYLALIMMITLPIGCGSDADSKAADEEETAAIPIEASLVDIGDISALFSGTASLEAENEATVVAKVSGVVKKLFVEEGDFVKQGKVLAKLDDEQLLFRRNQARANLDKLYNEYNRNKELFEKNLISADTFDKIKYEHQAQKAAYDLATLELNYTEIRAPINGVISERFIKAGNMIRVNQATYRITDFDPLNAILFVPERHMSKLAKGQSVELTVDALPDKIFTGYIERISPVVDPSSGTFKVTVEVKDPQRNLKPGMFGRIDITYDVHKHTLLIPKEAVLTEDKESAVFIVHDSVAYRQIVIPGYNNATHLEIKSGLKKGDTVVTIGHNSLKDSSKVKIIQKDS
jgi:membrane fusion protein (multidrug efflux system)